MRLPLKLVAVAPYVARCESGLKFRKGEGGRPTDEENTQRGRNAVLASSRRAVGGHARVGASESDSPEQKRKYPGEKWLNKTAVNNCGGLRFGDGLETSCSRRLEPTLKRRSKRERIYGQKAGVG